MSLPVQLPLGIYLRDDATFANFYAVGNEAVVAAIDLEQTSLDDMEPVVFLYGPDGVGCTHLLQAACHQADSAKMSSVYLPLSELLDCDTALLEGLETLDLVCIDELEVIAGNPTWEEALFHLFNRIRQTDSRLILGATQQPNYLPIQLADFKSRLNWGLVLKISGLTDKDKVGVLMLRAQQRGLELTEEVARYIIYRSPREMVKLFDVLNQLDSASLSAKRKLTIPFVKATMEW
ncbi:DnaA regulatory inactivator Hda [Spartinivicinus ruber]|uniref:DnaA regulatory inactivator Hda n=1 Tax=Spartinivicinus ruber TaxID=2683272 RepID=UPI0013CFB2B6|nr:DnaA regulatory inactivator Hda [Spartinivicinus ruber]